MRNGRDRHTVVAGSATTLADPMTDPWIRVYEAREMVRLDFDEYEEVIGVPTELANSSGDPSCELPRRYVSAPSGRTSSCAAMTATRLIAAASVRR